jgi:beta-ureidopropionase / N-carbamoyl-L-amino-acid hydrolase
VGANMREVKPLAPNMERFWRTIEASAEIGGTKNGGICRLSLSDEDKQMRDKLAVWASQNGYKLTVDRIGSMFIRREGREPGLPAVLVGSHLDTQFPGGRFDGVLGVMAGLELLRTLDDHRVTTRRAIEVVNWTNEEGARFPPLTLASRAFAGKVELEWALDRTDETGRTVREELQRIGYAGDAPVGGRAVDSYFELHIEQGPELDRRGIPVGIVVGGIPMRGMRIEVGGERGHVAGPPMDSRRNALVGAAMVAVAVNDIGHAHAASGGKTTAVAIQVRPNLPGIISDQAALFIDFRHPLSSELINMEDEVQTAIGLAAERSHTKIEIAERWGNDSFEFDRQLVDLLRVTAARLGIHAFEMRSQAAHDAYPMNDVAPTVIIFSRHFNGISHSESENMTIDDARVGINLLINAVVDRANR